MSLLSTERTVVLAQSNRPVQGASHGTTPGGPPPRGRRARQALRARMARDPAHTARNPRPLGRGERRPHRLARNRQAGATRLPTAARLPHMPGTTTGEDRTARSSSSRHGPATRWPISPRNRSSADQASAASSTNTSELPESPGRSYRHSSGTPQAALRAGRDTLSWPDAATLPKPMRRCSPRREKSGL